MKKTKKNYPVFVVDLTNIATAEEMMETFNKARKEAGVDTIDYVYEIKVEIPVIKYTEETNLPWYKRFWNWITRKK